jgi:hypothetical protein
VGTQDPCPRVGGRLSRLTRFFELTRLDDAVTTSARPYGVRHDAVAETIRKRLDWIKPYLFAVLRVENSRIADRARPGLRRLELVICDELVLHYEYEGDTIERTDAVCYIATRQEKQGRRSINIGTAYLELDPKNNQPHWFPLGRQLAQFLGVPTLADAFTMLLTAGSADRNRMLADRQIQPSDLAEAQAQLRLPAEDNDDLGHVLDSLLLTSSDAPAAEPGAAPDIPAPSANSTPSGESATKPPVAEDGEPTATPAAPPSPASARRPALAPKVDYANVPVFDANPASIPTWTSGGGGYSRYAAFGWTSSAPSADSTAENIRIGKRGEEIAFHVEQERVRNLGKNPESVRWVSKTDELSPFDIVSVAADDQLIYIEVKSTKSPDPSEAFYISNAELLEASYRRSHYYIYRVTSVNSGSPVITRWADPLAAVKEGKGRLLLANARMALSIGGDSDAPNPGAR